MRIRNRTWLSLQQNIVMSRALRVVVTGSGGGVGAITVRALLEAGHEVMATDRLSSAVSYHWEQRLHYIQADLTDAGSAFSLFTVPMSSCMLRRFPRPRPTRPMSSSRTI